MPAKPRQAMGWERMLDEHPRWLVLAIMAVLFAIHLRNAAAMHLNADEALNYVLAHQRSFGDAYAANNTNAHPPLLDLILYFWIQMSSSEWFLRLIPVFAYCGMIWFSFAWGAIVLGREGGLVLAALLAFAPPVYNLAMELRPYTLALCFPAGALYYLELGLGNRKVPHIVLSAVALMLAILSDYSVLWFTIGIGVYGLFRIWKGDVTRPVLIAWSTSQVSAILLYGALYLTHISKLRTAEMAKDTQEGWLRSMYRQPGDDPFQFVLDNVAGLYEYLFASKATALVAFLMALAGAYYLLKGQSKPRQGLLLAATATFTVWLAAALSGLYPLGGSRHSILLVLWICAVIAAAAGVWLRGRRVYAVLPIAMILWRINAIPERHILPVSEQRREFPVEAVSYLQARTPRNGLVFIDYQSALLLCYYYPSRPYCIDNSNKHFLNYEFDRFRVAVSRTWSLDATQFASELGALKREYQLQRQAEVWVFDGGWGSPVNRMLEVQYSGTILPGVREFGEHMSVFRVPN